MSRSACNASCGFCGGCSAAYERPNLNDDPFERCAECQVPIGPTSVAVQTTQYTAVATCSMACAKRLLAKLGDQAWVTARPAPVETR